MLWWRRLLPKRNWNQQPSWIRHSELFRCIPKILETSVNQGIFNTKLYLSIKGCLALKAKKVCKICNLERNEHCWKLNHSYYRRLVMKSGKHQFFIIKTTVPQIMLEASWRSTILCFLLANCDEINKLMQRFYWSKC